MEIFSRYNVCSTLLTLSHRREQRKQRRASIDTEVGTNYAFKHYPRTLAWGSWYSMRFAKGLTGVCQPKYKIKDYLHYVGRYDVYEINSS